MVTMSTRARFGVWIAGVLAACLVLGGVALANLPTVPGDFAPFTMRVTWWTSAAMQRTGQAPVAGTAVQQPEYRGIDSWKLSVVSSSWDPTVVGTAIEVNNGLHSTFLAQIRRLVSRVVPQGDPPMAPYRWLSPGLIDFLPRQGFLRLASSSAGTATFIESDASKVQMPNGSVDVVKGTVVVFDAASRLPLSVKTYGDGVLRESLEFEVVSKP